MSIEKNYNIRFIASLALREKQIQQNYRPIIAVHKWFARRPGTLFRGLLLSEFGKKPVEKAYYEANEFPDKTVADPFMGGGTPLLEANRLGCDVVGTDINPMATWIVREEIDSLDLVAYEKAVLRLTDKLAQEIGDLYKTRCTVTGRDDVDVKYFLWVKIGTCESCDKEFDLFQNYILSEDARHPAYVLVCPACGDLNEVKEPTQPGSCGCGAALTTEGPVKRNKCVCPHCGHINSAPFHGAGPPRHRMFAIEYFNPELKGTPGRLFKKPDAEDLARANRAEANWIKLRPLYVPDDLIPEGDESSRLHRWGYKRFRELFNPRQLFALETTARQISSLKDERIRRALATNFSDLLRYQNMLCRYDSMALKSLDIFSIHGFPVSYVQVESNFLGMRNGNGQPVGSGGWINITNKYNKAKQYCFDPFEMEFDGKKKVTRHIRGEWIGEINPEYPEARKRKIDVRCESATEMQLSADSLDAVFTDPPYLGMVQYGELMQFCYVWLRKLMGGTFGGLELETTRHAEELTGNTTAERDLAHFATGLAAVYTSMASALKPGAPLAFTFHHNQQIAYLAAGMAILDAGLTCTASLPCPAEMSGSIHIHGTGSSIIDTVFVCRRDGKTPIAWVFEDARQLSQLISRELTELRLAGMNPTQGDIRCIAYGHITRMAIANLRSGWDSSLPAEEKLARVRSAMDALAKLDDVKAGIEAISETKLPAGTIAANENEKREVTDALAF